MSHEHAPCRFCTLPDKDRIVFETKNFSVLMSLGPIVEGYALIVSREHYSCAAEIPSTLLGEFTQLVDLVQDTQRSVYGQSTIYEHGRSGACLAEGEGEDHCYHAHVHLVPMKHRIRARVMDDYPILDLGDWPDLLTYYETEGKPYLMVMDDAGLGVIEDPQKLPRHYLRSVAAEILGEPHLGDWAAFPSHDIIRAGADKLRPALAERADQAGPVLAGQD